MSHEAKELSTPQLLQMCLHHAGKAEKRAEFFKIKSTASYKEQAAGYAQQWLEFFAGMADRLELMLELERAGISQPLTIAEQAGLRAARLASGYYSTPAPLAATDEPRNE
jgi:hypothetical protein